MSARDQGPGRIGGIFGRSIKVEEPLDAGRRVHALRQLVEQRFAGQVDGANGRGNRPLRDQLGHRRGDGIDQGHVDGGGQGGELERVPGQYHASADAQRNGVHERN